jgi:transposase-like protein
MVVLGPLSYSCPRCGSTNRLDEHPDGKGFVEGSCLRCGEGWVRREDWGAVQCPRCSSTNVCEEDIDETSVIFECNACFQRWMRPVQEAISRMVRVASARVHEVQLLDSHALPAYGSSQEEEPERKEQPVIEGRTYWVSNQGPVHTIDLTPAGVPAGAYAWRTRVGQEQPDGTVTWQEVGEIRGIGPQKFSESGVLVTEPHAGGLVPGCASCKSNGQVVRIADEGFVHWHCQRCGVGWKVREDIPHVQLPEVVEDVEWPTLEASVTSKTAAGIAVTDNELEELLKRSRREAVAAREAVEIRRYEWQRRMLFRVAVVLTAIAWVCGLISVWATTIDVEIAVTGLFLALTGVGLIYYRDKHHHRPNKSLTRKGD